MAIDRDAINEIILSGLGNRQDLGGQWDTNPVWVENKDKWEYGYNVEEAKRLLEVPEASTRRAMLESGEAQIAGLALKDSHLFDEGNLIPVVDEGSEEHSVLHYPTVHLERSSACNVGTHPLFGFFFGKAFLRHYGFNLGEYSRSLIGVSE